METLLSFFRYIFNHVETTVGVSIALILVTGILLLIRMLMEKPAANAGGSTTALDVEALEGTLKRVLGQAHGMNGATTLGQALPGDDGAGALAGGDPAQAARMQALITEREKMIVELQKALAAARTAAGEGAASGGDALALLELQNKVRDLEARLAEYSIIEDDIADLSMYKDENARLKQEIESLRAQTAASGVERSATAPQAPVEASAAAPKQMDPVDEFATVVSGHSAPAIDAEKSVQAPDPAPLSEPASQDAIDAMFATAAAAETSDAADGPLMGTVDTSKMIDEVASLEAAPEGTETDVLEGALDTDKLLSEVDALKTSASSDPTPNEDLFGEFTDEEKSQG